MPAPPLISPSTVYSGPPPPYSYPSSAASSLVGGDRGGPNAGQGSYISPPETRRTSGDEKELPTSQRQSLPSITEALGGEQQPISISSLLSSTAPQQRPSLVSNSPISPLTPAYLDSVPRGPPDSFPTHRSSSYRPQDHPDRTNRPICSPADTAVNGESRFPPLQSFSSITSHDSNHTTRSSRNMSSPYGHPRPGASPIQHIKSSSPICGPIPRTSAPSLHIPTGYSANSYHPATSYPSTASGVPSYRTPTLQQAPHTTWPNSAPNFERVEELRKARANDSPSPRPAYGESVKRHLDNFDLESSLNEVSNLYSNPRRSRSLRISRSQKAVGAL